MNARRSAGGARANRDTHGPSAADRNSDANRDLATNRNRRADGDSIAGPDLDADSDCRSNARTPSNSHFRATQPHADSAAAAYVYP